MHYHLEIIMPPTDDIEGAISKILAPFDESYESPDGDEHETYYQRGYSFWDWYVIGGRWAGEHKKRLVDPDKLQKFYDKLNEMKITVSSLVCGKEELKPASQAEDVDRLWREMFPESGLDACPIFAHYNDQYSNNFDDVCFFKDLPPHLTASKVIIAGHNHKEELRAEFMIEESNYNGVTFVNSEWDGTIKNALELHQKKLKNYKPEYKEKYTPKDDWLVITVDYHS